MLINQTDARLVNEGLGAEATEAHDPPFEKAAICDSEASALEQARLRQTVEMIPDDIHTALEIGFYDFRLTNLLRSRIDLVSLDLPRKVSDAGGHKLTFADVQHLPFGAKRFDLIICTEVLEHFPEEVLTKAVEELQRVSAKYLLISVPYRQRIWNELFKCGYCGFVCNSMGHVRYMDDRKLTNLFNHAIAEKIKLVGKVNGYAPDWLYSIASGLGNAWCDFSFGSCPKCGRSDKAVPANLLGHVLRRVIWRVERWAKARPAWVITLFKLTV